MQCPSVLSAPTLMGHFYSLNTMYIAGVTHDEELRCGALANQIMHAQPARCLIIYPTTQPIQLTQKQKAEDNACTNTNITISYRSSQATVEITFLIANGREVIVGICPSQQQRSSDP